ncbi:MAG: caspase family protein, partial [Planctomycetaceae bacterium]|nr:caspase family protein [Planctomycetaceae bacterium]
IEKMIRVQAAEKTQPGDEVLIFWSGHGDSVADVDGDEQDGRDEVLIPYDANRENIKETSITDDTFGRWLQALDGRKIVVLLDACKSGGQANNEKGLGQRTDKLKTFDFLDNELTRTKDIGQKQAAVLASSSASQISLVRLEGDLSVMTYFLIEKIKSSDGALSLQQAFEHLSKAVPDYVKQKFPGYTQTPVLIGDEKMPFNFRE